MPTPLIDHIDARLALLQPQAATLAAGLPALNATEQTQRGAVQAARQALQDADMALQRLYKQLAAVELPAAGDPLLKSLQAQRITRAEKAAALRAAEEALLDTQVALARQQQQLEEVALRVQQLQALRGQQQGPHTARQALLARLAGARLAVQDEAAARNADEGAAAEATMKQDLPPTLLARLAARQRMLDEYQRRLAVTRRELAQLQAGLQPGSRRSWANARLAEVEAEGAALADAGDAVVQAASTLAHLTARPPRLNAVEKAALAATPGATAEMSTRASALTKQAAFDTRRLELAVADGQRRRVHLQLLLDDPKDFPPAAAPRKTQFEAAQTDFQQAQDAFDVADSEYTAKHRKAMNDWLAGISDALFADLEAYLAARARLKDIDEAQPATIRSAITDAETAAVDAFVAEEQRQLCSAAATRAVLAMDRWLAGDPGAGGRRLHDGLRGAP